MPRAGPGHPSIDETPRGRGVSFRIRSFGDAGEAVWMGQAIPRGCHPLPGSGITARRDAAERRCRDQPR